MDDRDLFVDYRLNVVRLGLVASWLALGGFAISVGRDSGFSDRTITWPLAGIAAITLVLTLLPWRRVLRSSWADAVIFAWVGAVVTGLLIADGVRAGEASAAEYLATVVFAGAALVAPITLVFIGGIAGIGYGTSLVFSDMLLSNEAIWFRVAVFAGTTALIVMAAWGLRSMMQRSATRLHSLSRRESELARHEAELTQLYDVSRTIGIGSNLAEVLPELVGRITTAVGARTGVVLLYRPNREQLEVMSPLWVAGHTLRAEGYRLQLTDPGILQRVFTSNEPVIDNDLRDLPPRSFLAELNAKQIVAVPLQIESKSLGVLAVADKLEGEFTAEDATLLQSLAGPSALVLNQMARYEEARETGEKMAELAQLKTEFVSVVSHELRTPLTSIIGSLKTLQRPELAPADPNAQELLATAERQAERLRSLIEDLLVVSRLDNRALPVRPEPVKLLPFLEEIVTDIPGATNWVTVSVDAAIDEIRVDPGHLRRIVTNLIDNALKYAPRTEIDVQARARGSEVYISVVDHGSGIPYELHEHIFDRFTQVDRHETRGSGGTGLGLSIVRGLSEAMGGRTWFEPTVGGGATFTVALPVRAGTVPRPESEDTG